MGARYFDHVATNPLRADVLEAMLPYFKEEFGNPLSNYRLGVAAREAIEKARGQVGELIGAKPQAVIFTASGAESNNMALRGLALAKKDKGTHVIVSKVEHHSVLNAARFLEKSGFTVTYLPIDGHGLVTPEVLKKSMTKETVLVSVSAASSEVGTIEPTAELAKVAHEGGALFHADGVATTGNIPVDVKAMGVDAYSIAAHQFYGPKGAGALYVKEGTRIVPLIYGGIQEGGRRAGTENVPAIVGMGAAAAIARASLEGRMAHLLPLRDKLIAGVMERIPNVLFTGAPADRLPGHASFCVEYIEGESMMMLLEAREILVASGSACSSKALKSSPVLLSMGIPSHVAQGSVVFTMGEGTTEDDVTYVLETFPQIVTRLREISPYAGGRGWGENQEGATCIPQK